MKSVENYKRIEGYVKGLPVIILIFCCLAGYSQNKLKRNKMFLKLTVIPVIEGVCSNEATLRVFEGNIARFNSSGKIKNDFFLEKNKRYTIKVSRPGYKEKLIKVSTKIPKNVNENSLYAYEMKAELIPRESLIKDGNESPVVLAFNEEKQGINDTKASVVLAVMK